MVYFIYEIHNYISIFNYNIFHFNFYYDSNNSFYGFTDYSPIL